MAATKRVPLQSAIVFLVLASAGLIGSVTVEASSRKVTQEVTASRRAEFQESDSDDDPQLTSTRAATTAALKADGADCTDNEECANACVSVPCDEQSYDDSGDCGGTCGELATVDYEPSEQPPPEPSRLQAASESSRDARAQSRPSGSRGVVEEADQDEPSVRSEPRGVPFGTPFGVPSATEGADFRFERCPGNPKSLGQICHRNNWRRRCNGSNRCAWGRRRINGQWRSVGVCKRKPAKPIFNCAPAVTLLLSALCARLVGFVLE